jgi:8-oxo-dGTP diphosphatase
LIFNGFNRKVTVRVSGILIRDGAMLLIAHKKKDDRYWLLPGGGVEYGESLDKALEREFREELGIGVRVDGFACMCDAIEPHGNRHILSISFRCSYRDGEYRIGKDRRLFDYGFFSAAELPGMRLYPPINDTLVSIMENREHEPYLGRLWRL